MINVSDRAVNIGHNGLSKEACVIYPGKPSLEPPTKTSGEAKLFAFSIQFSLLSSLSKRIFNADCTFF